MNIGDLVAYKTNGKEYEGVVTSLYFDGMVGVTSMSSEGEVTLKSHECEMVVGYVTIKKAADVARKAFHEGHKFGSIPGPRTMSFNERMGKVLRELTRD